MSDQPVTYLYTFKVKDTVVRVLSEDYETAREFCLNFGEKHHIAHIKSEVHRGPKNSRKRSEGKV